jgi:predicted transcriptional regulator
LKKRSRLDIYAAILGFLKRHPEGCQVTRLSYGAGLPIDRIKLMLDTLARCDLVNVHVIGDPLQEILNRRRYYSITRKGLQFLEAYGRVQELVTFLESEPRQQASFPMDFID